MTLRRVVILEILLRLALILCITRILDRIFDHTSQYSIQLPTISFLKYAIRILKHPTARIVSRLGGKADDRAEAPTGGLCRTASWVHEKP